MRNQNIISLILLILCIQTNISAQNAYQKYAVTRDSILKAHPDSLVIRITSDNGSNCGDATIIFKNKNHWSGIYLTVFPRTYCQDENSKLIKVTFQADTIVEILNKMGLFEIRPVTEKEFTDYYFKINPIKDSCAAIIDPIGRSSHGWTNSIYVCGKKTSMNSDLSNAGNYLQYRPIKIFNDIVNYMGNLFASYNR